jgi:hypothetical protein
MSHGLGKYYSARSSRRSTRRRSISERVVTAVATVRKRTAIADLALGSAGVGASSRRNLSHRHVCL